MITYDDMILKLLLAVIFGGLIGLEREIQKREAGLRTHILVCLGSTLIMLTSIYIFDIYKDVGNLDPSRIAAGVMTGIGFIGAGAIIKNKDSVKGLTTAASIWIVASIGLAIGCGFIYAALITTVFVLIVLLVLRHIEKFIIKKC
ncbi:MAG TPA: MgtC/SapB family protein [Candidatus Omnitrophica bacterium]|nr:MgtC/SapB family protein [Candidatus Omnitrophota bacterium]